MSFRVRERLRFGGPLLEKKAAQGAEIIENAAALVHVQFELLHAVESGAERLQTVRELRGGFAVDVGFNIAPGFTNGFLQKRDELVGTLDAVEGASGLVSHGNLLTMIRSVRALTKTNIIALNRDCYLKTFRRE